MCLMMALEGHTLAEIGKALGLSYTNAGVRLHRLKKRLSDQIQDL